MIVLIEGNEGSGKTTLINSLLNKTDICVLKLSRNFKYSYELYVGLVKSKGTYIFDRSFITDLVYRMWDHQKGDMTFSQIGYLVDNYFKNIKIVFCENKNSWENAKVRGEDFIKNEESHKLIDDNFFRIKNLLESFTEIQCMTYDYDYNSVNDVIEFIKGGE